MFTLGSVLDNELKSTVEDFSFETNFSTNQLMLPNIEKPFEFAQSIIGLEKDLYENDNQPMFHQQKKEERKERALIKGFKGTTTLAFIYEKGTVVAVDSRATSGQYIASQSVQKVVPINSYMLGTLAGGAADCQFFLAHLGRICNLYELRNNETISVAAASKLLNNILYSYRNYGLSVGSMICGYDTRGPQLYYIDSDGSRLKNSLFSVGSGSPFAYGVLDAGYRWDLSKEEALDLGRRAICAATFKDSYSGGTVKVYHIDENGWVKISDDDASELWYSYEKKEKKEKKIKK